MIALRVCCGAAGATSPRVVSWNKGRRSKSWQADKFVHSVENGYTRKIKITHTHVHPQIIYLSLCGATTSDEFKKSYHLKYGYISYHGIRGRDRAENGGGAAPVLKKYCVMSCIKYTNNSKTV